MPVQPVAFRIFSNSSKERFRTLLLHSRTIFSDQAVIEEVLNRKGHIMGVATTAWRPGSRADSPLKKHQLSYETAQHSLSLFENDSVPAIKASFIAAAKATTENKLELVKIVTGCDVSKPPVNPDGSWICSQESLSKLKVAQLREHHKQIPNSTSTTKKTKQELIADIIYYRTPQASPVRTTRQSRDRPSNEDFSPNELIAKK
jgi:hypothetical protein